MDLSLGIVQRNVVSHTGAGAATRILGQPVFMGELEVGSHILIVDDVVTYGSTLANLRGWIQKQGATVLGATTLAAAFGATKVALPESVYARLVERFPGQSENLANELGVTLLTSALFPSSCKSIGNPPFCLTDCFHGTDDDERGNYAL